MSTLWKPPSAISRAISCVLGLRHASFLSTKYCITWSTQCLCCSFANSSRCRHQNTQHAPGKCHVDVLDHGCLQRFGGICEHLAYNGTIKRSHSIGTVEAHREISTVTANLSSCIPRPTATRGPPLCRGNTLLQRHQLATSHFPRASFLASMTFSISV